EGFGGGAPAPAEIPPPAPAAAQPLRYRPCVTCGALMNRRNYGRKRGVIVGGCARRGPWFRLHELDRLLRRSRGGGAAGAGKLQHEQEKMETRQQRLGESLQPWNQPESERLLFSRHRSGVMGELVSGLVGGAIRWFFD